MLAASTPNPWWIRGRARAALSLPFPLPSFDVEVGFEWGQSGPTPLIDPIRSAAFVHPKLPGKSWDVPVLASGAPLLASEWPVVPLDAVPVVSFAKPLTGISLDANGHAFEEELVEGKLHSYRLSSVVLRKVVGGAELPAPIRTTTNPRSSDVRLRPAPSAQEPQAELWWYSPLDTYDKYSRENYENPCSDIGSPVLHRMDFTDVPIETVYRSAFHKDDLGFETFPGFQISTLAVRSIVSPLPAIPDRGLRFGVVSIRFPEPVTYVKLTWGKTLASNGNVAYTVSGSLNGSPVALPSTTPGQWLHEPLGPGSSPSVLVDALGLIAPSPSNFALTSVEWSTYMDWWFDSMRDPVGDRTGMASELVLEPHTSYTLEVRADRTTREDGTLVGAVVDQQVVKYGFRTGGLPGTDYALAGAPTPTPDYADGLLNDVGAYVKRTIPKMGAPAHYRGYDALVEMRDPYAHTMLAPGLQARIRDRNGVGVGAPASFVSDGLPFLTPGLLRMLTAPRAAACAGTPVTWSREILPKYVACSLDWAEPRQLYRIELTAPQANGAKVFGFELTTSRFLDAKEHLASGLVNVVTTPERRGQRVLRNLGSLAAPPAAWMGPGSPLASRRAALLASRASLAAVLAVSPHDVGTTLENATRETAAARADIEAWSAWLYEALDRGASAALPPWPGATPLTYAGAHPHFVSAGLTHRPLPPKTVEALAITAGAGWFVMVESPEPIDWMRVTVTHVGSTTPLPVVSSGDGTRAFIFDTDVLFGVSESVALRFAFARGGVNAPDLDLLRRSGDGVALADDVVIWDLIRS